MCHIGHGGLYINFTYLARTSIDPSHPPLATCPKDQTPCPMWIPSRLTRSVEGVIVPFPAQSDIFARPWQNHIWPSAPQKSGSSGHTSRFLKGMQLGCMCAIRIVAVTRPARVCVSNWACLACEHSSPKPSHNFIFGLKCNVFDATLWPRVRSQNCKIVARD